jgi:hypothetical protein
LLKEGKKTIWLEKLTIKSFILSFTDLSKLPQAGLTGTILQGSWWPLIKTQGTSGCVNTQNWNWFDLCNSVQYHQMKLKSKLSNNPKNRLWSRFLPAPPVD